MMDHDQRFKSLLKTFFAEFFQAFFPAWAERFEFAGVDWLEQEVFSDPPRGERECVDLVARLPLRAGAPPPVPVSPGGAGECLTLIHVEIESQDTVSPLRPRMFSYYEQLRRRHGLPVLPIALYLRVGLDGIGWDVYEETYWDHRLLSFTYAYVGLPALDGEQYVAGEPLLGVALTALMHVPPARRAVVHAEALHRLASARENEYRRYLLLDCLEAYTTLDATEAQELEALLRTERYREAQAMPMTSFEKGLEQGQRQGLERGQRQGEQSGRQQGQRMVLETLLETRFGPLGAGARARLEGMDSAGLEALTRAFLTAHSLRDLGLED